MNKEQEKQMEEVKKDAAMIVAHRHGEKSPCRVCCEISAQILNHPRIAILDENQGCKIQRIGSEEYEDTTFTTLYDNVRRIMPKDKPK